MPAVQHPGPSAATALARVKDVLNKAGIVDASIAAGIHLPPRGIQIVADYVGISKEEVPLLVMELSVKLKAKMSGVGFSVQQAVPMRAAGYNTKPRVTETMGKAAMHQKAEQKAGAHARVNDMHNERMIEIYEDCMSYIDAVVSGDIASSDLARVDAITKLMHAAISASQAVVRDPPANPLKPPAPERSARPEPAEAVNDRGSQLFEKQSRFGRARQTEAPSPVRPRSFDAGENEPVEFPESRARRRFAVD